MISSGSDGKASDYNAGDPSSIPGSGRSSGEGNGTPLQYSCLENPMDGGAWWATVHRIAKSHRQLSYFTSLSLSTLSVAKSGNVPPGRALIKASTTQITLDGFIFLYY